MGSRSAVGSEQASPEISPRKGRLEGEAVFHLRTSLCSYILIEFLRCVLCLCVIHSTKLDLLRSARLFFLGAIPLLWCE